MSRYIIKKDNKELTYGFDHALGYFYDITNTEEPEDSSKHLIETRSTFLDRLKKGDFVEVLEQWGANKSHLKKASLDLPF